MINIDACKGLAAKKQQALLPYRALRLVALWADIIRPRALDKRPYKFYLSQMQISQQALME